MADHVRTVHREELITLLAAPERAAELKKESRDWPSWDLTSRQLCDLELLLNGGFSPLQGFMNREDYDGVCREMRLGDGTLWPMPITLDVTEEFIENLGPRRRRVALRDAEGEMLAALSIEDIWRPEREAEAKLVFGTSSTFHPGVAHLLEKTNAWYVGGRLEGVRLPWHYDFRQLRLTPAGLRAEFARLGWRKIVAFHTHNPMHRAHYELTLRATEKVRGNLLIHTVVGMTTPGDVEHYVRVRCYQALLPRYPEDTVRLALLPLAMRMAGPREALWHAIIRKNYGCTHFIVGRDHAGPGMDQNGKPFYGPYEAQALLKSHEKEIGVKVVPFRTFGYLEDEDRYVPEKEARPGTHTMNISGTELRRRLAEGRELPAWFTFPEVARELQKTYLPRRWQGFTVFFTGLSGSGKSTIANVLRVKFLEMGGRPVTLLDEDIVRKHLSSELDSSREQQDINIRLIGFVASEITKNGGIAICAPIAPDDSVRKEVRAAIQPYGGFVLVHVSTPLETCEARDRKGLYTKPRAGIVKQFTGISDPCEAPGDAAVIIDTTEVTPEQAADEVLHHLENEGYIRTEPEKEGPSADSLAGAGVSSASGRAFEETVRAVIQQCLAVSGRPPQD